MENKEVIQVLKLTSKLLELHGANPFKIRAFQGAIFNLEKVTEKLFGKSVKEILSLEVVKKGMAENIFQICTTGALDELTELVEKTPSGVIEMLEVKGVGPKKIKVLWLEHEITSKKDLLQACLDNKISSIKGFGEKTQETIKNSLLFTKQQEGKYLYAEIETVAYQLEQEIAEKTSSKKVKIAGQIRRLLPVIDTLTYIIESDKSDEIHKALNEFEHIQNSPQESGPFVWRGTLREESIKITCFIASPDNFEQQYLIHSSGEKHLGTVLLDGQSIYQKVLLSHGRSEEEVYDSFGFPYILPEIREGQIEIKNGQVAELPTFLEEKDLKGVLHNHCTYSDGIHSLEEMALYAKELGYQYLGISDHSKTAYYANGLDEDRVIQQQQEIETLNEKIPGFKIFKGIESDILNDGSLDYDEDILKTFDFIVSSIHAPLQMDLNKAMMRLIKAIENPYTTILGHMTGRLLLRREGYPVDHKKVIDACSANGVCIEINANPRRLDIDWQWVSYCLEKEVVLSINPDAHQKAGYHDMKYGVLVGRKGGLTPDMTLNAWGIEEVEAFFNKRKV